MMNASNIRLGMLVEKTHHVEASEPDADGFLDWRYEYDLYRFSDQSLSFVARSYLSEPDAVHFLRVEQGADCRVLTRQEFGLPVFREAVAYLQNAGFSRIDYLGQSGYVPVPSEV